MMETKFLPWDSDFFRKKINLIKTFDPANDNIKDNIIDMFNSGNDLVYVFSSVPINLFPLNAVLADIKISYILSCPCKTPSNSFVESFYDSSELLHSLAIQSGQHSRFKVDSNFSNEEFEKLYKTWIDNSVNSDYADHILVYKEDNLIKGMITGKVKQDFISIGLLATDSKHRGKGIGSALIQEIENIASDNNLKVEVTTQANNNLACNFYEKRGYRTASKEYIYHVWRSTNITSHNKKEHDTI